MRVSPTGVLFVAGALLLSGCPNSIESPECFPQGIPTCEVPFFDAEAFLIRECGDTCHNPNGAHRPLNLQEPNIFERLAVRDTAADVCSPDMPFINLVPENDAWQNSSLLARVHGRCGEQRMPPPQGFAELTDAEKDCLENWVGRQVIGPTLPDYCEGARFEGRDVGSVDTGSTDTGSMDAASPDAGSGDTGASDDSGANDSGSGDDG